MLVHVGATGVNGTSVLTAALVVSVKNIVISVLSSSMLENLIDKGITVLIAYVIVRRIPKRFLSQYALDDSDDQADLDDLGDLDEDEDKDRHEVVGASSQESSAQLVRSMSRQNLIVAHRQAPPQTWTVIVTKGLNTDVELCIVWDS